MYKNIFLTNNTIVQQYLNDIETKLFYIGITVKIFLDILKLLDYHFLFKFLINYLYNNNPIDIISRLKKCSANTTKYWTKKVIFGKIEKRYFYFGGRELVTMRMKSKDELMDGSTPGI